MLLPELPRTRCRPGLSEPPCHDHWLRNHSVGKTCNSAGFGTAVVNADLDQDVLGRFLGILDEDVEVAILIEHARVEQFVLEFVAGSDRGLCRPGWRTGRPPADTCRGTSCTNGSACCRGRSSTP